MAAPSKKESLPSLQIGVREGSNVRMKLMARPMCPIVADPNKEGYTGEPNCQLETSGYPGWWKLCEERGHDPYHTVTRTIKKEPIVGEDGIISAYRERVIENKKLNTVRVPIGTRFHSGRGESISRGLKGRKTLTEMGYKEKCEFRNCELDAKLKSKYGMFCGDRHARLIGADVEGIMLSVKQGEKNKQLRDVDPAFEGTFVLQSPPDLEQMV